MYKTFSATAPYSSLNSVWSEIICLVIIMEGIKVPLKCWTACNYSESVAVQQSGSCGKSGQSEFFSVFTEEGWKKCRKTRQCVTPYGKKSKIQGGVGTTRPRPTNYFELKTETIRINSISVCIASECTRPCPRRLLFFSTQYRFEI